MKIFIALLIALQLFAADRIVALSPSINEILYALGAGEKIVGNTDFCHYPEDAKTKAKVGGYFSPSLERILALSPDLVIMQKSSQKLAAKLEKLGIKSRIVQLRSLEDIKESIRLIAEVVGEQERAKQILLRLELGVQKIEGIVNDQKILIVIGHNLSLEKRIFVVGQNLYLDDIITASGNRNAFSSMREGQPILNMENIIATDPDIVILLSPYRQTKNLTKKALIKPWLKLPIKAVQNGHIYVLDKEYAGIASDRLILFLEDFRAILRDVKSQ
jgi:iron complex transport system substrate-binding protein